MLKSEEAWLRTAATRSLMQIDALDAIDRLQALVRKYPPAGEPYSWQVLGRRGALSSIPIDRTGVPFEIDPVTGEVTISPRSQLSPLPAKPGA
jgi:hypothetical protein